MKFPTNILWLKETASPTTEAMTLLENKYEVFPTFVEETITFQEALEDSQFDFVLIQLPISDSYRTTILTALKNVFGQIPSIVIDVSTNTDKINWIKAGVKDALSANEIELLPILVERQIDIDSKHIATKLELKRKEIEYATLFYNSPEAILVHDFNEITQANAAFLFQLGYLNEYELIGRLPLKTIIHPEDVALLHFTEKEKSSESIVIIPNIRLLKKNKTILKCDLRIISMYWDDAWHSQIILQEIANKKSIQAYLEAKEQSQMLLQHAEQVPGVIYQFKLFPDDTYRFTYVSNSVYKTHEITAQELMDDALTYFKYVPEEDRALFREKAVVLRAKLDNFNLDYRLLLPNLGLRWMRCSSTPVPMPDRSILWYGYVADITTHKLASFALKDREEQVRTIFKYAPDAIVVLDFDGNIVEWNPKAAAIFGWTEEEAIGNLLHQLIGPERNFHQYEKIIKNYKNDINGAHIFNQALEVRAVRKNGEEFSITMALSETTIKGEQFCIVFISDITKRKNEAEKLKKSLLEKEVLLTEIHHRVKNNMQVITSLLSLQSSFIENDSVKALFKNSQYRINSMGMIHEMLYQSEDISKIDYGVYLERLIEGLIRAMKGEESSVGLEIDAPSVSLNIDSAIPLGLIVNELVTNALKYAFPNEQKGKICVKLSCLTYPNFRLEIGDDGIGFYNKEILKKRKSLGLTLVSRLATQLKGSIEHLATDKGTRYVLLFQEIFQF